LIDVENKKIERERWENTRWIDVRKSEREGVRENERKGVGGRREFGCYKEENLREVKKKKNGREREIKFWIKSELIRDIITN